MAASAIYEAVSSQCAALMSVCMAIVHYYTEDLRRGDCRSHVTVNSPIGSSEDVCMLFGTGLSSLRLFMNGLSGCSWKGVWGWMVLGGTLHYRCTP
jgi:hypothetical protein